jgi:hypothetical protein
MLNKVIQSLIDRKGNHPLNSEIFNLVKKGATQVNREWQKWFHGSLFIIDLERPKNMARY